MLTGQRPFRATTPRTRWRQSYTNEPALSGESRALDPAARSRLRHCLEKQPEERFQSARDLAFDLEALSGLSTPTAATAVVEPTTRRRSYAIPLTVAGFVLGALMGLLVGRRTATLAQPTFQRLTFQRGTVYAGRFGPDGQTAYYSASWDGAGPRIYSRGPAFPSPRRCPFRRRGCSASPRRAKWRSSSSRGRAGSRRRAEPSRGCRFRVASPRKSCRTSPRPTGSPGDRDLAVVHRVSGKDRLEFPIGKVLFETAGWIQDPRFAADGKRIAFIDHQGNADGGGVALVDLAGKKTDLATGFATVQGLAWSADGGEIWFTAARTGIQRGIFAVTTSGKLRLLRTMQGTPALLDLAGSSVLVTEDDYRSGTLAFLQGQAEPKEPGLVRLDERPRALGRWQMDSLR